MTTKHEPNPRSQKPPTCVRRSLLQEAQAPGISRMVDEITSGRRGITLYSTEVTSLLDGRTYKDLVVKLLEDDISVICVNREGKSLLSFNMLVACPL